VPQDLKSLAASHEKLGDYIQGAILALWKFCADNPQLRAHTDEVHEHLDRALEMHQKCSGELDRITREEERPG
jgi:hypothetical protein